MQMPRSKKNLSRKFLIANTRLKYWHIATKNTYFYPIFHLEVDTFCPPFLKRLKIMCVYNNILTI